MGLPFIPRPKLNRDKLAAALIELAHNDHLRAAASALGDKIRAEKGVDNAVRLIEKCPRNATSHLA